MNYFFNLEIYSYKKQFAPETILWKEVSKVHDLNGHKNLVILAKCTEFKRWTLMINFFCVFWN